MMRSLLFYVLLLIWNQDVILASVQITELRMETHIAEGETALFGCKFHMEDDNLYSLKWFKDGMEFYRYAPKAKRPIITFPVPGVKIDHARSSINFVTLKHLTRESAGTYSCEVYGEGPSFTMDRREKTISVDLLPKSAPIIVGLKKEYQYGSEMNVNCTTGPSRPEAQLAWFINGHPPQKEFLQGPMHVISTSHHSHPYQTKLNLHFTVYESHFLHGVLTIKCQAAIPPLYNKETSYSFYDYKKMITFPLPVTDEPDRATIFQSSIFYLIVQAILYLLVF